MLCPRCSALIDDDSLFCSKCGAEIQAKATAVQPAQEYAQQEFVEPRTAPAGSAYAPRMSTYLTQNILLTVFAVICCMFYAIAALPTAVTGLVFSSIADGALRQNDMEKANQFIKLARIFMWISFGIEIASFVLSVVAVIFLATSLGEIIRGVTQNFNFDRFYQDFGNQIWR
jgi:Golgi nucleoside diphosphatase